MTSRTLDTRIDAAWFDAQGWETEPWPDFHKAITKAFDCHDIPRAMRREERETMVTVRRENEYLDRNPHMLGMG